LTSAVQIRSTQPNELFWEGSRSRRYPLSRLPDGTLKIVAAGEKEDKAA